jgi:hypothetical protein
MKVCLGANLLFYSCWKRPSLERGERLHDSNVQESA